MSQDFVFELVRSKDMVKIGELTQARDRELGLVLNRAGTLDFNLPLTDETAMKVQEVSTGVQIKRRYPNIDPVTVWSGAVWTAEEQTPNTLSVGCVGWLQTLEKRVTKPAWSNGQPLGYVAKDASVVAFDLLTRSNADNQYGVNYVFPGVAQTTQPRTITYQPYSQILDEITSLSDIESGFDLLVDPATRLLNTFVKIQNVQSKVTFEYQNNVPNANRQSDSSRMCNRFIAYSPVGQAIAEDQASMAAYGLFEEAVSISDIVDISILQAYANGEVAVRSTPLRISSFVPRQFSTAYPDDPRIFKDFNLGDICYMKVNKGRFSVPRQAIRLFGLTVQFPEVGKEKITQVQTTAS